MNITSKRHTRSISKKKSISRKNKEMRDRTTDIFLSVLLHIVYEWVVKLP